MKTVQIDILNPKAMALLEGLEDLNLIKLKKSTFQEFAQLLAKLRNREMDAPSLDEIQKEVDIVRSNRLEDEKNSAGH